MKKNKKVNQNIVNKTSLEKNVLKMIENSKEKGILEKDVLAKNPDYEKHILSLSDSTNMQKYYCSIYSSL